MATSHEHDARNERSLCKSIKRLIASLAVLGVATPAVAQDWEIEPFIELVATYTDNLYLAPDGLEESSLVGQVDPGINLRRDGGRFSTATYYRLQSIFFSESSDLNTIFHQLDTSSTLEFVTDHLFVDINGSIDQSVVDPSASIPTTNVVATENLADVYTGDVNPYFMMPVGSAAFMRIDYEWGFGRYDGFGLENFSRVDDFTRDAAGFYLGTGQGDAGFEWSLMYDYEEIDYETVSDYRFERGQVAIGLPIGRRFRLLGMAGLESDLIASRQQGGLDSDFWEAGFRINVGRRQSFEFRTGERFFGTSYYGNIDFTGRRVTARITYSENPTTSALYGLGSLIIPLANGEVGPEAPPPDDLNFGPIRAEVYVAKTLNARVTIENNRSTIFATAFHEDREFLDDAQDLGGPEDGQMAVTLGFGYELGPRTDMELSVAHFRYDYAGTDVFTDLDRVNFAITRQIGRASELRFAYRHVLQDTNSVSGFNNYTENAADLALVKRF